MHANQDKSDYCLMILLTTIAERHGLPEWYYVFDYMNHITQGYSTNFDYMNGITQRFWIIQKSSGRTTFNASAVQSDTGHPWSAVECVHPPLVI